MKFLLCLFCLYSLTFECPMDSFQIPNENVCVYAIPNAKNYSDAVKQCAVYGGVLAKVQNVYENSYLLALAPDGLNGQPGYVGVIRKDKNTFTYSDGSPLVYQNWDRNEPLSDRDCAILIPVTGKWLAANCSLTQAFFCSVDQTNNFPCPSDWIYNAKTGYCYYFQDFTYYDNVHWQLYNWSISESNCRKMGAHLVSIHTKEEDDFIYDLIASNVADQLNAAPDNEPCFFQYTWIGYYGNGTLGTGQWSDGSPVDYNGLGSQNETFYWAMANDASCKRKTWDSGPDEPISSRYVCKMASKRKIGA